MTSSLVLVLVLVLVLSEQQVTAGRHRGHAPQPASTPRG
jgi:hypothetical protein